MYKMQGCNYGIDDKLELIKWVGVYIAKCEYRLIFIINLQLRTRVYKAEQTSHMPVVIDSYDDSNVEIIKNAVDEFLEKEREDIIHVYYLHEFAVQR